MQGRVVRHGRLDADRRVEGQRKVARARDDRLIDAFAGAQGLGESTEGDVVVGAACVGEEREVSFGKGLDSSLHSQ